MNEEMENVVKELSPLMVISTMIAYWACGNGYNTGWIPRREWNIYKDRASKVADVLKDFGITNEIIENLPKYKDIINR